MTRINLNRQLPTFCQVIFGKQVKAEDLEPVAIGVPRAAYKAKRAEEMSFEEHDTMRVLACQTFAKQV